MNMSRHTRSAIVALWGTVLLACAMGVPKTAHAATLTRIVSVTERFEGEIPQEFGRGVQFRRLPLFMDEVEIEGEQVFQVYWQPPERGLPHGAVVVFEYRHPRLRKISSMSIEYDKEVRQDQIARFIVPRNDVGRWGRVTAWRVRILLNQRMLAQQTSDTWR